MISAPAKAERARSMPIASILSPLRSRTPAVSMNSNGVPSTATGTSIRSRVVPAISDTIAASRSTSALSKVDLPLLGGPPSTMRKPSRNFSAAGCASIAAMTAYKFKQPFDIICLFCDPTSSSSEKSSSASVSADNERSSVRHTSTARLNPPPTIAFAARRCHSVSADRRSAKPSASFKSIRPLRNARRVNSPGSARRNPIMPANAFSTARTTARPPCRCSSARSSPLALSGPGKTITKARSSASPLSGCRSSASDALRGIGTRPASVCTATNAAGPLIRTIAIAAGGTPLDSAKIVSAALIY